MKKRMLYIFMSIVMLANLVMVVGCVPAPVPTAVIDSNKSISVSLTNRDTHKDQPKKVEFATDSYVNMNGASDVTFAITSMSEGLTVGAAQADKFDVTVATVGTKTFKLSVSQKTKLVFDIDFTLVVTSTLKYYVANGDFETGDLTGWTSTGDQIFAIANNATYFDDIYAPIPNTNKEGECYLDGFGQSNGFDKQSLQGSLQSSLFEVGGSRYVTFLLGGGNQAGLKVKLMEKAATGSDKLISMFNNWKFQDPYYSISMTKYGYQIPVEYLGKSCYFIIEDTAIDGEFPAITADSFVSYYAVGNEPNVDNVTVFTADFFDTMIDEHLDVNNATNQVVNGNFETGDMTGWFDYSRAKSAYTVSNATQYFETFYPDNIPTYNKEGTYFLTSTDDEKYVGRTYSKAFKVEGSRWISFRMGGSKSNLLSLKLMHYNADGRDEIITQFNNWKFQDPYRSWGMTQYAYELEAKYANELCYFVIDDNQGSGAFAAITLDDVKTYYPEGTQPLVDDITIFKASYMIAQISDFDKKLNLDAATTEIKNGSFETGNLSNWFTNDLDGSYGVYDDIEYFGDFYPLNKPIYGADGKFLTGCYFHDTLGNLGGLQSTGKIFSQAFVVGGSRYVTFKMGGNNVEKLKSSLMLHVAEGDDIVIANFNNYLFSDPYRGMSMTTYGYQIPAEYLGMKCYFVLDDGEAQLPMAAISLDSVKTFYETAPTIYEGAPMKITNAVDSKKISDDKNIYPAGYVNAPPININNKLGLDTATTSLRNGDFETGDRTGWFSDISGEAAYTVSNAETYFDFINPTPKYNKDGVYFLDGFAVESYIGKIYSQAFVVGNSRWITFKLGGNNTDNLKVSLLKYVDGVNDEVISVFNNYLFSDPYRAFGMTRYAFQIPEKYLGQKCYFVLEDNGVNTFGAFTADSFKTDYDVAPVLYDGQDAHTTNINDDMTFAVGYITAPTK